MKKNYFLAKAFAVAAFIGLANSASAQYYTEDFDAGFNGNWAFLNSDGLTPAVDNSFMGTNAWITLGQDQLPLGGTAGDSVAISNSWYTPAGQSDDWMWTVNPIDLGAATAPRLSWEAYSNSTGFAEDYEVYIDTLNTNFGPTTTLTPVFSIVDGELFVPTTRFVDATAFAGRSDIYIAFRNVSNDDDLLVIDDINIAEAPTNPDMVTSATPVEYSIYALPQATNIVGDANLENTGGDATGATVTVNVIELTGMTVVHTETSAAAPITSGSNLDYTGFTGYVPTAAGDYGVQYIATINETENDMTNDTAYYVVQVSDSLYGRDLANVTGVAGRLGIGTGQGGAIGNMFQVTTDDTLTSVQAFIVNQDGHLDGYDLVAKVYSWNGTASTEIATTVPVALNSATNAAMMHELTLTTGDLILGPGMYIVAVQETDSNMQVGYTAGIYTTDGTLIYAPGFNTEFADLSGLFGGSQLVPVIRAVFGTTDMTVGIAENEATNFEVFPNPAVESIMVKNALGTTIEIYNSIGQVVYSNLANNNNFSVNVSNFDNGIYTIKSISGDNTTTQSFVKQ